MGVKLEVNSLRSWELSALRWTFLHFSLPFLLPLLLPSITSTFTSYFTSILTSFYHFLLSLPRPRPFTSFYYFHLFQLLPILINRFCIAIEFPTSPID